MISRVQNKLVSANNYKQLLENRAVVCVILYRISNHGHFGYDKTPPPVEQWWPPLASYHLSAGHI